MTHRLFPHLSRLQPSSTRQRATASAPRAPHRAARRHWLPTLLTACGGGGGGEAGGSASASAAPVAPTPVVTVATLVPAATMGWSTSTAQTIGLTVRTAEGLPAAEAAVRIFTLSRLSPQDGAPLEEPVPVSLLDTAVTDATGRVSLNLRWPAHETELLVVATAGDQQARGVLGAEAAASQVLTLGR